VTTSQPPPGPAPTPPHEPHDTPAPPAFRSIFGTDDPSEIAVKVARLAALLPPLLAPMTSEIARKRRDGTPLEPGEYIGVEGWAYVGALLGVFPVARYTTELRDDAGEVHGFEALVELVTRSGDVVGGGIGECSWTEPDRRNLAAFQLKSQAQTRATSRAFRLALGFVVKAAGLDATPAEEMADVERPERPATPSPVVKTSDGVAAADIRSVADVLNWAWRTHRLNRPEVLAILKVDGLDDGLDAQQAIERIRDEMAARFEATEAARKGAPA
jgi:hypothetical protein